MCSEQSLPEWHSLLDERKTPPDFFSAGAYHSILCESFPRFLHDYLELPLLQRLKGVGLLCGMDWTPLFHNRFYYSRFDHSVGVALIIWHFTHDKAQTISGLLHDVSTCAFSHVIDFKNGDALTQESTEKSNTMLIQNDMNLAALLARDGIALSEVQDYHKYPIADNDCPGLSADRLEYMYPSGAALAGTWTLHEVAKSYARIAVLQNELGLPELGFVSEAAAVEYTKKFCAVGLLLQRNEDKTGMQLLADVVSCAIDCGFLSEHELFSKSEAELISYFESLAARNANEHFTRLFTTFRKMSTVQHCEHPLPDAFCVSLAVKKRYVNPLVCEAPHTQAVRISQQNKEAAQCIQHFLQFKDSAFGCVPWCCP